MIQKLLKAIFFGLLGCILCSVSIAQVPYSPADAGRNGEQGIKRSVIRGILNKFSITLMSGYGRTRYAHDLSGFSVLQQADNLYIMKGGSTSPPLTGYTDWFVAPEKVNGLSVGPNDTYISSDTTDLRFSAGGNNIPLILAVHYNFGKFRFGAGVSAELQSIGTIKNSYGEDRLGWQSTNYKTGLATRIFALAGVRYWDYWDYSFVVDLQIGKLNLGENFNESLVDQGMFFNLGLPIEKNFSELFRIVLRPAVEFKSYSMRLPEADRTIDIKAPVFYIQAGLSLNYPKVPRCPIPSCRTQVLHVHFGKEYRGQPITKKQNPGYGENHPELLMHKGKKGKTPKNDLSRKRHKQRNGLIDTIKGWF